jgi:PucR C-terminal helix-turn-helix domain
MERLTQSGTDMFAVAVTRMRELLGRLSELDHGAESLVRVIAYFDTLVDNHVGLETIVRSAAALGGCTAGASDPDQPIFMRVDSVGKRYGPDVRYDPGIRVVRQSSTGLEVWLERPDGPMPTDMMVLERFVSSAAIVIERAYGRAPGRDPGQVELLIEGRTSVEVRLRVGRRLCLPTSEPIQVVAVPYAASRESKDAVAATEAQPDLPSQWSTQVGRLRAYVVPGCAVAADPNLPYRAGIGPLVGLYDLHASWQGAVTALRLTAAGTDADPGPRQLHYNDLGGLAVIAESFDPRASAMHDVEELERVQQLWPWALSTLEGVASHDSLRQAANHLYLHHSTVQQRVTQLESAMDLAIGTVPGRLRLQLALALRRVRKNGPMP